MTEHVFDLQFLDWPWKQCSCGVVDHPSLRGRECARLVPEQEKQFTIVRITRTPGEPWPAHARDTVDLVITVPPKNVMEAF